MNNSKPIVARGYLRLAIELSNFLENFIPHNWTGPIKDYAHVPQFLEEEVRDIMKAHREKCLHKSLEGMGNKNPKFERWFVRDGILNFFYIKEYAKYESELN